MLYAVTEHGKTTARPDSIGHCPNCQGRLMPKCGSINVWHWAHLPDQSCDPWLSAETDWHLYWKSLVPPECTEVPIKKNGATHIADILRPDGLVVELQHSSISPGEIAEREAFYKQMIWLFDIRSSRKAQFQGYGANTQELLYSYRLSLRSKGDHYTFRWKHPRKHIAWTTKRTFLDIDPDGILFLKKMYPEAPCGGWGHLWTKEHFISRLTRKGLTP